MSAGVHLENILNLVNLLKRAWKNSSNHMKLFYFGQFLAIWNHCALARACLLSFWLFSSWWTTAEKKGNATKAANVNKITHTITVLTVQAVRTD